MSYEIKAGGQSQKTIQSNKELDFTKGLGQINQTTKTKLEILKQIRQKRKSEELKNQILRNNVSLLQNEEQKVLNKIISISFLKNKINQVKELNSKFQIEIHQKERFNEKFLQDKKMKIVQYRKQTQEKKSKRIRDYESENQHIYLANKKQTEEFRAKKAFEFSGNIEKVKKWTSHLKANHLIALKVYKREKRDELGMRLDSERIREMERLTKIKRVSENLERQKLKEINILEKEQLIQEKLFDELKIAMLRN